MATAGVTPSTDCPKIGHMVTFKFQKGVTEEAIQETIDALNNMVDKIPSIRGFKVHRDIGLDPARNYDLMILAKFDDENGWKDYMNHPIHLHVIKNSLIPVIIPAVRPTVGIARLAMARTLTRTFATTESSGTQWVNETLKEKPKEEATTTATAATQSSTGGSWLTQMLRESEEREKKMEKEEASGQGPSARLSHLDNFQDVYQKLRRKSADGVMDHGDIAQRVYEYSHKRAEQEREEKQRKAMETKKPAKGEDKTKGKQGRLATGKRQFTLHSLVQLVLLKGFYAWRWPLD
ncbi:hypothetical protein FOL47_006422 [Perkinsus chesapeaki]|uniref:Stress-response A/B barrel domain-containing protein n=1 Tax=Perkinsus chesapeaki TaxID=330153 RepID=A0A7J6LRU4_PERCH|nr:hypothetical protein FOL47_006422 [Perkinsus chesapeaki]